MQYVVTAGMVTVEMDVPEVPGARALRDVHRGDLLPESVPAETIGRLLGLGHIAEVEEPAPKPVKKAAPKAES